MEISAKSSAPGKLILFGEHAVVYGVTALAAALSDLRIFVEMETTQTDSISVYFHDILLDDGITVTTGSISLLHLIEIGHWTNLTDFQKPLKPTEDILNLLKAEFSDYSLPVGQAMMSIAYLAPIILPELTHQSRGFRIDFRSKGLPIGAGLGSSAAFSVALTGAMFLMKSKLSSPETVFQSVEHATLTGTRPPAETITLINDWAFCSEVVIHGCPSGLDNNTSALGGFVKYDKGAGKFESIAPIAHVNVILTNTKVPRSTRVLVAGVRSLHDTFPSVVKPILESIGGISRRFLDMCNGNSNGQGEAAAVNQAQLTAEETVATVGSLMTMNHHLLCALGVGHAALDQVCAVSLKHGMACKLTGAGGGGCAFTLAPAPAEDTQTRIDLLQDDIRKLGFDVFVSSVGGPGVLWH